MAVPSTNAAVAYQENKQRVVMGSWIDQLPPTTAYSQITRFSSSSGWSQAVLDGMRVVGLGFLGDESFYVGARGEVWAVRTGGGTVQEQLPDSGLTGRMLGQPNQLRVVAGRPYVCGQSGQVYTRNAKGQWVHMDDGVAEEKSAPTKLLLSIDGSGPEDLYTVGNDGMLFYFDGARWTRLDVDTNVYLAQVRCYAKDRLYIVGKSGTFIESDGTHFPVTQVPGAEESTLWDVIEYKGKLYVAANKKMFVREAGRWKEVRHGLEAHPKTDFVRFTVGEDKLWVMGTKRLFSYDGRAWQAHIDPDNG